ncbi:MAG TPA: NAD-dependent epimerase/dehydratase family protein [Jatrophihabitans sp.]|nr:NAD-dependent epimerase/dehydratase family protein [Jatrophihabitans sp.]
MQISRRSGRLSGVLVLLTGGAGFIGRHVLAVLRSAGREVRVLDSLRADVHGKHAAVSSELIRGDVREASVVAAALDGVDVVCHLAAKVGLGVSVQDLPDYASSNDYGTAVLLAEMARAGVQRLVLASSMVVYGEGLGQCRIHGPVRPGPRRAEDLKAGRFEPPCPRCGRPLEPTLVAEDAPVDPRNGYAASKLAQEHLAGSWARATGGAALTLRYHNVYGPGMPRDTPYAGVAAIFGSVLRAGRAPRVFEDGRQRRDFVHVRDVAAATSAAVERSGASMQGTARAYNIGSGTPRTVGELASALSAALGGPPPVVTGQFRLGDVRHVTADSARARAELGWLPAVDFEAGIAELVRD